MVMMKTPLLLAGAMASVARVAASDWTLGIGAPSSWSASTKCFDFTDDSWENPPTPEEPACGGNSMFGANEFTVKSEFTQQSFDNMVQICKEIGYQTCNGETWAYAWLENPPSDTSWSGAIYENSYLNNTMRSYDDLPLLADFNDFEYNYDGFKASFTDSGFLFFKCGTGVEGLNYDHPMAENCTKPGPTLNLACDRNRAAGAGLKDSAMVVTVTDAVPNKQVAIFWSRHYAGEPKTFAADGSVATTYGASEWPKAAVSRDCSFNLGGSSGLGSTSGKNGLNTMKERADEFGTAKFRIPLEDCDTFYYQAMAQPGKGECEVSFVKNAADFYGAPTDAARPYQTSQTWRPEKHGNSGGAGNRKKTYPADHAYAGQKIPREAKRAVNGKGYHVVSDDN